LGGTTNSGFALARHPHCCTMNSTDHPQEPSALTLKCYDKQEAVSNHRDFILRKTQKLSKTGNWEFDAKTRTTRWSDEMFNIHGLHREFNTNDYHAVLSLYEESSRELFLDAGKKLFEEKKPFDITARIITPLGHVKWVHVLGFPIVDGDNAVGIAGITADITTRKESELLLRASEAKFQKTFSSSPDLMAVMRENDMLILDVNDRVFPMLGYTRDELIGRISPGLQFYDDPSDREKFLNAYFSRGAAEIECVWLKKTGEPLRVMLKGTRIEINCERYFLIVIKDVSMLHPITVHQSVQSTVKLNRLLKQLEISNDDPASKLVLPTAEGFIFVRPREIIYCEAHSNYTQVHLTDNRKHMISKTLKDFEYLLPKEFFFRTHNSYIVNLTYIKKYNKGESILTMENGATLDVSKRKKESFLNRIGIMGTNP
jgi:PAS domain S-box-containing protein